MPRHTVCNVINESNFKILLFLPYTMTFDIRSQFLSITLLLSQCKRSSQVQATSTRHLSYSAATQLKEKIFFMRKHIRLGYFKVGHLWDAPSLCLKTIRVKHFIAEIHARREAPRVGGTPQLSKSTHPKKFGNHVTVHRPSE